MKTQEQFLREILELKTNNSEMEIHFCVDSDEILESGWTAHMITKVEVSPWYAEGERIYTDEDEIKEHFEDLLYDEDIGDSELESLVNEMYSQQVKEAICVFTHAG